MADTVGMTLVLKADAKGVVAEMKNAQGAVIDTARIMRSQLKGASEESAGGLAKMKESMGKARETAMFFTQSLGELGAGGRTAQIALSGLGSMLLGGGIVGAGLAAAQVAVRLLSDAWTADAEAARKAAEENKKATDEIRRAAAAARDAAAAQNLKNAGGTGAMELGRAQIMPTRAELAKAQRGLAGAEEEAAAWRDGSAIQGGVIQTVDSRTAEEAAANVKKYADQVAALQEKLTALEAQFQATTAGEEKSAREQAAKAGQSNDGQSKAEREKAEYERKYQQYYAHLGRVAAAKKKDEEQAAEDSRKQMADEMALQYKQYQMAEQAAAQVKQQWQAAGSTIAGAMGDIGNIIGGAASSWMQYFGQLIQKAIQLGIAMAATAGPFGWLNAAAAGIALISAVTSVPEFRALGGPVAAGSPYIVGERGPELFVPTQSGGIVPNNALGGGLTINISTTDAKSVRRLFLDNQAALAEAIGKAVRDGRRMA